MLYNYLNKNKMKTRRKYHLGHFYIADTQWWYDQHGGYDADRIKRVIKKQKPIRIYRAKKYGWNNMPLVVCFDAKVDRQKLTEIENAFKEEFGDGYSFSLRDKDWDTKLHELYC